MEPKPAWQSKTLIVNAVLALSALFLPSVGDWVQGHGTEVGLVFAGLNMVLRLLTKKPVDIFS